MTIFLILILILLISNPNVVSQEVYNACVLWFTVLLPTMYPSFLILDLIYPMPMITKISKILYKPMQFFFKIHSVKSVFLILVGVVCGAPASTKLITEAFDRQEISKKEYENLICAFSTLSLPYTLLVLKQFHIAIWLYYIAFFILAILWMQVFQKKEKKSDVVAPYQNDILNLFFSSIHKNLNILTNILGILIIFRVIIRILFGPSFPLYPYLEILGGIKEGITPWIIVSALGFLGISIHLQILSIAKNISYSKFLFSRILFLLLGLVVLF